MPPAYSLFPQLVGERAVDVFYLTRADGKKLTGEDGEELRAALLAAARDPAKAKAA